MLTPSLRSVQVRIHADISFCGNISGGKCIASDAKLLDAFSVSPHNRRARDIFLVSWKSPSAPWIKVNTDGSVIDTHAASGGLLCDHLG
jgi:hypothetical protein